MAWWVIPAVTLGVALYTKHKTKGGQVRWIALTEQEVKQLPAGLVLAYQMETGDVLPQPPAGYKWKPISILASTTPITPPQEIELHVLEPVAAGQYPTAEDLRTAAQGAMGSSYMTWQELQTMPELAGVLGEQGPAFC